MVLISESETVRVATSFIIEASAVMPTIILEVKDSITEPSTVTATKSPKTASLISKAATMLEVSDFNTTSLILLSILAIEVKSIAATLDTKSDIVVGISVVSILIAELTSILLTSVVNVPMLVFRTSKELLELIIDCSSISKLATAALIPADKFPTPVTNVPILVVNSSNTKPVLAPSPSKDSSD